MIRIRLSFNRRSGQYTASAFYEVGRSARCASDFGSERAKAVARCLSKLRSRGHGGKPYKVLADIDGDGAMAGVVPRPKPRPPKEKS